MILEKDPMLRTLYKEELEDEGYVTIFADDDKDVLQRIKESIPDLFITHYQIPSTESFIDMLRHTSEEEHIPIIINTAYPQEMVDEVSCGVVEHLTKTADFTVLKNKIDVLLHSYSS